MRYNARKHVPKNILPICWKKLLLKNEKNMASVVCLAKGIGFKQHDVTVWIEKSEFPQLQFILWNVNETAVGKIFRISKDKICKFQKDAFLLSDRKGFVTVSFSHVPIICSQIYDNHIVLFSLTKQDKKIALEECDRVLIKNFLFLLFELSGEEQERIMGAIRDETEKVLSDIVSVVLKSSGIRSKNLYTAHLVRGILIANYAVIKLLLLCRKKKE